jgi:hypothetical protein
VDVGDQRHAHAPRVERGLDRAEVLGVGHGRGGDPDDLAAGVDEAERLLDRRLRVEGSGRGHALDANRVVAADAHAADHHLAGAPARARHGRHFARSITRQQRHATSLTLVGT